MYILQVSKIHGSIWKILIYKFQPRLIEGNVYAITEFGVGSNGGVTSKQQSMSIDETFNTKQM